MGKQVIIRGDGANGKDGVHGRDGMDGAFPGAHGQQGLSATEPTPGQPGQYVTLSLTTADAVNSQSKLVQVLAKGKTANMNSNINLTRIHQDFETVLFDDVFSLETVPRIRWTATGGNGGNGANGGNGGNGVAGADGRDAVDFMEPATDGQPGGNGGNGGAGSSGACGGDGGHFNVSIHEKDAFLLMLLDPCEFRASLLVGGKGGRAGAHGSGALGSPGGKGGKHRLVDNGKSKTHIPAGADGSPGANGLSPTWELNDGLEGKPGAFSIDMSDGNRVSRFQSRYNIVLHNLEYQGKFPMGDPMECEFGDVISIRNIKVRNNGLMPLPKYQEIHFSIKDTADPNVIPLQSRKDAFLPAGTVCGAGKFAQSEGELNFFAGFPGDVDDEYDFDPLHMSARFFLQAFQYGPISPNNMERRSNFIMEFPGFHTGDGSTVSLSFSPGIPESLTSREDGIEVTLRYPIENSDGLKAARSLFPGETTIVSFKIQNVSANVIGGYDVNSQSKQQRRVALRFFYLRSKLYDLPAESVCCRLLSRNSPRDNITLVDKPSMLDVPTINPGEACEFNVTLTFGNEVIPYSRMALVVDMFVQSLPAPEGIKIDQQSLDADEGMPPMSVVQRRKLEFICEPIYEPNERASFVLVTSYATSRAQFEAWTNALFIGRLYADFEVFSVSRYGTLDPKFKVGLETTLRDAFRNKVVVILTEQFKVHAKDTEEISPLQLLPNGCMQQTSGFDPSTRFLIVGVDDSVSKSLLQMHLRSEPQSTMDFPDQSSFQKAIQSYVNERAARGHEMQDLPIQSYTVQTSVMLDNYERAASKIMHVGKSLATFLKQKDPLNQYTIECVHTALETETNAINARKQAFVRVRRGFNRCLNSAVCVIGKYCSDPKQITSDGTIMAIAQTMTSEVRVKFLVDAIRNDMPSAVLRAFQFACVSDLIRDAANFLKADMKMNQDLELSFPSIATLHESVELLSLVRECKSSSEQLRTRVGTVLSDLLARLELVSNSKDLRPRFSLDMFSKRKSSATESTPLFGLDVSSQKKITLDAMTEMVGRLRIQWKSVISNSHVETVKQTLKSEVKSFLHQDAGTKSVNYRSGKLWMQGLNYVHSVENDSAFGIANPCKRLIELDLDEVVTNYKIPVPSIRVYSSHEMEALRKRMTFTQDRCVQLARMVQLSRTFAAISSEDVLTYVDSPIVMTDDAIDEELEKPREAFGIEEGFVVETRANHEDFEFGSDDGDDVDGMGVGD